MQAILSKRKKRIEYGQTIVEGPRMVFDLLQNPKTQSLVRQVLISTVDFTEQYQDRLSQLPSSGSPRIQLVTPEILKSCTDTVTPQGIVALVDIPKFAPRDNTAVSDITVKSPLYLVLDGVADPGNLGTLCRSSYAVGISGVLLLPGCCDIWNPKAVRSSMGASFQLPVVEAASWDEAVDTMTKEWNAKRIYAATMIEGGDSTDDSQNTSHPHYDIDWLARPTALVIGSEGNGLSVDVRKALVRRRPTESDEAYQIEAVHVPMQAGIESLNAAICGSVIMFEYARQCSQANK
jgi:tRNA G18 (ribose-2'-O)-methylase SpoU